MATELSHYEDMRARHFEATYGFAGMTQRYEELSKLYHQAALTYGLQGNREMEAICGKSCLECGTRASLLQPSAQEGK